MSVKLSALVLFVFTMSMLTGHTVYAQEVIKGHVTDQSGVDLEGVTVQSKLTHKATTTNGQGNFEINVKIGDELTFTYVGYKRKAVLVSGPRKMTVVLVSDQTTLNDAVVIGYGTVRRKDLTGSVGSMNMADFNQAPVRSF